MRLPTSEARWLGHSDQLPGKATERHSDAAPQPRADSAFGTPFRPHAVAAARLAPGSRRSSSSATPNDVRGDHRPQEEVDPGVWRGVGQRQARRHLQAELHQQQRHHRDHPAGHRAGAHPRPQEGERHQAEDAAGADRHHLAPGHLGLGNPHEEDCHHHAARPTPVRATSPPAGNARPSGPGPETPEISTQTAEAEFMLEAMVDIAAAKKAAITSPPTRPASASPRSKRRASPADWQTSAATAGSGGLVEDEEAGADEVEEVAQRTSQGSTARRSGAPRRPAVM